MTKETFDRYRAALEGRLKILGLSRKSAVSFGNKIRDFDSDVSAVRWSSESRSFLISSGCAKYPGSGNGWCDEFLVEESGSMEFSRKLLELTVYYHLTLRPLEFSDVIEIGTIAENNFGYSHIFSSVPFFFPGSINVIELDKTRFALQWLMPIFPKEAEFIEKHGSDEFEKRLKSSQYDYFDLRSDLEYLAR